MTKRTRHTLTSIVLSVLVWLSAPAPVARPSLLVYDFDLNLGPVGNVDHVRDLGFDGIVTRVATPTDLLRLREYALHTGTLVDFDLLAFVPYDFNQPVNAQVWRDALPVLASVDAPLWVIVRNAPSTAAVRQLLGQMATESQAHGIPTVIYPHWYTDIESAAEAAELLRDLGHPNLRSSLHTCHEIRAGNQHTLETVVARHAGVSALVTIAGAQPNAYAGPYFPGVDWGDAIRPLDDDAFSLLPFLQALHDEGYDGPVVLQTFGITGDPDHRVRSLRRYAEYLEQVVP